MWGHELPRVLAMRVYFGPEAREQFTGVRKDADARPKIGEPSIGAQIRTDFADEAQRTCSCCHVQRTGSMHDTAPQGLEFSVAVEHLDTIVFPVGDVKPTIRIAMNVVRQVELSFADTALPPGEHVLPVRRVLMDLGIAVPVHNVNLAFR